MPSFAGEVKNELARVVPENDCCRLAELVALFRMGATLTLGAKRTVGLNFTTENAAVARKALSFLKGTAKVDTELTTRRSRRLAKNNSYLVRTLPSPEARALLEKLGLMQNELVNVGTDDAILHKSCCRVAYLRGAFLGGGSVNRPEADFHLELVAGNYQFANLLLGLLKRLDFPANLTDRKDNYIVYLKEGDGIIDFLGMLGATAAVNKLEVAQSRREIRNQVNRLVNCETANLAKVANAAARQLAGIRRLEAAGALKDLPTALRVVAEARRANPSATLAELARIIGIGKSGLNHRLRKLDELAKVIQDKGE